MLTLQRSVSRIVTATPAHTFPVVAVPGGRLRLAPACVQEDWTNDTYTVTVFGDAVTDTGEPTVRARLRRYLGHARSRLPFSLMALLPYPNRLAEFGDRLHDVDALPAGVRDELVGPDVLRACAGDRS